MFAANRDEVIQAIVERGGAIGVDDVYSAREGGAARAALKSFPARTRWENFWLPGQEVFPPEWSRPE